ncbi:MAG: molecular chaperone DnaJ [Patescibacteria group bacterium]
MAANYYDLLGVNKSASTEEIKKAFRAKAHQFHPDKSNGDAAKFKEINEAYQVLNDAEKRRQYDQFGQTYDQARRQGGSPAGAGAGPFGDFSQPGGFTGNVDFGDLGDIFGDMFGFGGGSRRRGDPSRGSDIQATIHIPFKTAAFGGEETIQLRHRVACSRCHGQGAEPGTSAETCHACKGSGQVRTVQQTILGAIQSVQTCPTCQGEGTTVKTKCTTCHGQGRQEQTDTITVKIPSGIADGQSIKLSGKGEAGMRGMPAGDLFLEVDVAKDSIFTRDDDDVLTTVNVPLTIAGLGGTVSVETLDGRVTLKIPAGTPSGKVLVLKSKGIPHLRGRGRGDQRVTAEVVIPKNLSARAKRLLKELQDEGV